MTTLMPAVTGDVGDTRTVELRGVEDLSGVTSIVTHIWPAGDPTDVTNLTTTVLSPTDCTIVVALGTSGGWLPTADVGVYKVEYQVTFGSTVLTWPQGKPDLLQVRAQGA